MSCRSSEESFSFTDEEIDNAVIEFLLNAGETRPTWELLSPDENPMYTSALTRPQRLSASQLTLRHTVFPEKDTPMSFSCRATESEPGLVAVWAWKGVQENSKLLKTLGVTVAGNESAELLHSRTLRDKEGFVFLQAVSAGSKCLTWDKAEKRDKLWCSPRTVTSPFSSSCRPVIGWRAFLYHRNVSSSRRI